MAKKNDIVKVEAAVINSSFTEDDIRHRIYTIRGVQVMLDRDLAIMYGVETGALNRQVKRNIDRFPSDFMFQLTKEEWDSMKCQNGISNMEEVLKCQNGISNSRGGARYLPYAFTEEGVSTIPTVLRSPQAAQTHVLIMRAFVAMRKFIIANAGVLQRLERVELKQLRSEQWKDEVERRFDDILDRMDDGSLKHKLGMFFDGQMFESYSLVEELVKRASKRVVLIDDYVDAGVLEHFRMRGEGATVDVYVNKHHQTTTMKDTFDKYHAQYPGEHVELHTFNKAHDRWLIIDDEVYHFGASIKDLGLKWFSVNRVTEYSAEELIRRLN